MTSVRVDWIDGHLMQTPGVTRDFKAEGNWTRYMVGGKLGCALCYGDDGRLVYITMKLEPLRGEFLRGQFEDVIPGYYMNKLHWNSIRPDGEVPEDLMRLMLDKSYNLILKTFSKKKQAEILEDAD